MCVLKCYWTRGYRCVICCEIYRTEDWKIRRVKTFRWRTEKLLKRTSTIADVWQGKSALRNIKMNLKIIPSRRVRWIRVETQRRVQSSTDRVNSSLAASKRSWRGALYNRNYKGVQKSSNSLRSNISSPYSYDICFRPRAIITF